MMEKRYATGKLEAMIGKRTALAVLLIVAMTLLAACGGGGAVGNAGGTGGNANQEAGAADPAGNSEASAGEQQSDVGQADAAEQAVGATSYPLTLTDATGTDITLEQAPQRIVSLVPSETEVLFAVGAGEVVVGVDDNSNFPAETDGLPRTGGFETNIEAVAALNPDLIIANASINKGTLEELRKLGIAVFASLPKTLDETIAHIEEVGVIVDRQEQAQAVADAMRADMAAVADAVKGAPTKRVYLEFSPGWTVGSGEFLHELVTLAGGENVAASQSGWFSIDPEQIVQSNPEVIIYPDIPGNTTIPDAINSRPGWDQLDAIKNGQVFAVENDPLVRVGPRLTQGLKEIAAAIHPDRFE